MIRFALIFLLLVSPVLALECSNDSLSVIDSLPLELSNYFEGVAQNTFFNVTRYNCFEEGVNGTIVSKQFPESIQGLSFDFDYANLTLNFSSGEDYYSFETNFSSDELSVLSPNLLSMIVDFESGNLSDEHFFVIARTNCSLSPKVFDFFSGEKYYFNDSCTALLRVSLSSLRNESSSFFFPVDYFSKSLFFGYSALARINLNSADLVSELSGCEAFPSNASCVYHDSTTPEYFVNWSFDGGSYNLSLSIHGFDSWILSANLSSNSSSPALHVFEAQRDASSFLKSLLGVDASLVFDVEQAFNSSNYLTASTTFSGAVLNQSFLEGFNVTESNDSVIYASNGLVVEVVKKHLMVFRNNYFLEFFDDSVRASTIFPFINDSRAAQYFSGNLTGLVNVPSDLWSVSVYPSSSRNLDRAILFDDVVDRHLIPQIVSPPYSPSIVLVGIVLTIFLIIYFKPKRALKVLKRP